MTNDVGCCCGRVYSPSGCTTPYFSQDHVVLICLPQPCPRSRCRRHGTSCSFMHVCGGVVAPQTRFCCWFCVSVVVEPLPGVGGAVPSPHSKQKTRFIIIFFGPYPDPQQLSQARRLCVVLELLARFFCSFFFCVLDSPSPR